jgi:hypothetical protein
MALMVQWRSGSRAKVGDQLGDERGVIAELVDGVAVHDAARAE